MIEAPHNLLNCIDCMGSYQQGVASRALCRPSVRHSRASYRHSGASRAWGGSLQNEGFAAVCVGDVFGPKDILLGFPQVSVCYGCLAVRRGDDHSWDRKVRKPIIPFSCWTWTLRFMKPQRFPKQDLVTTSHPIDEEKCDELVPYMNSSRISLVTRIRRLSWRNGLEKSATQVCYEGATQFGSLADVVNKTLIIAPRKKLSQQRGKGTWLRSPVGWL